MTQVWRLCRRRHAAAAFSGEGARLAGGRWNLPGTSMVYTASSLSLAVLEVYVGLDPGELPDDYTAIPATIPDGVPVETIDAAALPAGWRAYPHTYQTQVLGTRWAQAGRTCALAVPSAVVPQESVYLLSPGHADFRQIAVGSLQPFAFDPRLGR